MAPDDRDVAGQLMTLVRKDLLRPDRAVFAGEDAFAFRHLLIRDAAYDSLPKAQRAELHARFAGWLLQRGADIEELDEIAGYHLERAFRYRAELGPVDDRARAIAATGAEHLDAAGRRALDRGDSAAAVNLLERASLLLPSRVLNIAIEESLINALGACGRLVDAVSRAKTLVDRCSAAGDSVDELRARLIGATWRMNIDPAFDISELEAVVAEARPVIKQSGDDAALASLEYAAGYVEHYRNRFDVALACFTLSMQHAKQANELWFVGSPRALAAAAVANGPIPADQGLLWLEHAQAESPAFQPLLALWRSDLLACLGQFDAARSEFTETVDRVSERGLATWVAIAMQVGWHIEMLAGDIEAAERAARLGVAGLEPLGERAWMSTLACQLGEALYLLGRYDESEEWALRGLALGGPNDVLTQIQGLQLRSNVLARRGDHIAARGLADKVRDLAGTTQAPVVQGDAYLGMAEVLHLAGDLAQSDAALLRAIGYYEQKGAPACITNARRRAATWDLVRPV
jgi:tetratricopeptide (TPR) repeat protein